MVDPMSLGVVDHFEITNNLIYGVIAITQFPYPPGRLADWDRGSGPLIKKQEALVWERVCFNAASPNQHSYPCKWGSEFFGQPRLQIVLLQTAARSESRPFGSSDYGKRDRSNIGNLLSERSSR
jgi:hypothetical protein